MREPRVGRETAARRSPETVQVERQGRDQQDREPETRQRDTERGDAGHKGVEARADPGRRQHAERDADRRRDDERICRDQDRVRHALHDQVEHRRARQQRDAEIACTRVPEPDAVLDDQRAIEAVKLADLLDALLRGVVPASVTAGSPGTRCSSENTTNVANTTIGRSCHSRRPIKVPKAHRFTELERQSIAVTRLRLEPDIGEFRHRQQAVLIVHHLLVGDCDRRRDVLHQLQRLLDDETAAA